MKWREDGTRCTRDDNRRRWIPRQFFAGDQIDMIFAVTSEVLPCDWEAARVAQFAVDVFLVKLITTK